MGAVNIIVTDLMKNLTKFDKVKMRVGALIKVHDK